MLDTVNALMTPPTASKWTPERVEKATNWWRSNIGASEISSRFWEEDRTVLSRNAVIGKLHRLGLTSADREIDPTAPPRPRRPRLKSVGVMLKRIESRQTRWKELTVTPVCEETFLDVSLMDLTMDTCRWPRGGERNALETTFCGQKPFDGHPYCAFHFSIGYAKPREMV